MASKKKTSKKKKGNGKRAKQRADARVSAAGQRAKGKKRLTKQERIAEIRKIMAGLQWITGRSAPELAKKWGYTVDTIERDAAEASRSLQGDEDRDEARKLWRMKVSNAQALAAKTGRYEAVKGLLDLEGKALGIYEAEKHEVNWSLGDLLELGLSGGGGEGPDPKVGT